MRCPWVAELLHGTFQLPNIEEMKKDVEKWEQQGGVGEIVGVGYTGRGEEGVE
ncbi:putative flavin-containing monooxygenase 1 [Sesbania bispinosa]|nr:putative flavin-containing monooxygenase 1 [Sesbania bispinosa]